MLLLKQTKIRIWENPFKDNTRNPTLTPPHGSIHSRRGWQTWCWKGYRKRIRGKLGFRWRAVHAAWRPDGPGKWGKRSEQESDQENKNSTKKVIKKKSKFFLFFLVTFLVEFLFTCFLVFFTFLFSFINPHLRGDGAQKNFEEGVGDIRRLPFSFYLRLFNQTFGVESCRVYETNS